MSDTENPTNEDPPTSAPTHDADPDQLPSDGADVVDGLEEDNTSAGPNEA